MYVFQVVSQTAPAWFKPADPTTSPEASTEVREVYGDHGYVLVIGTAKDQEPVIESRTVLQILSHGVLLDVNPVPADVPAPTRVIHQQVVKRTLGLSNSKLQYSVSEVEGSKQKTWSVSSASLGNLQRFLEGWNGKTAALSDSVGIVSLVL